MDIRNLAGMPAFTTKDGSQIRELLAHRNSVIRKQSLAEAAVPPGTTTALHFHPQSEEIYFILEGAGVMRIGPDREAVGPGDAIAIPPGSPHQIMNTSQQTLRFLCCCAPGYEHEDTVLVDQ